MANRYMTDADWSKFKNFKKSEFKCKCKGKYCNGYPSDIAYSLIELLQKARDHFGKAITITSGLRCAKHNIAVGGVKNSKHTTGQGADFYFSGIKPTEVIAWLKKQSNYNYAYTNNTNMKGCVHIDTKFTKKEEVKIDYEKLYNEKVKEVDTLKSDKLVLEEKLKSNDTTISDLEAQIEKLKQDNINIQNNYKFKHIVPETGEYNLYLIKDETLIIK